ncbi:serine hydrolase [Galbibacter mesophilus]|uniref:serine hydrolase n=1 Tax=Galbibacter mesophilus TaxID=379069 RepID=UPI001F5DE1A0|nr:serine hydrolase [Galbibacter mesophilus]MCM5662913.1 serine hydrolase [Galbibacter mesophilus]
MKQIQKKMDNQSISENLKYLRKLKGYSQEELSELTTVTVRTIQRIEKGEVSPHLKTVKLLASALEVEVDDLLTIENPKEENIKTKWLLLLHGTPILGLLLPLGNILFPLFLWIHKREDNPLYNEHGRKVINFQITMSILFLISFVTLITIEGFGFFFFILVVPFAVIVTIINIVSAINSHKCFYPLSIPFIKKKEFIHVAKKLSICIVFLCSSFMGFSQEIERLDGTKISSDSLTEKISYLMKEANVHGMAFTLLDNNKIAYQRTFGYKNKPENKLLNDSTNIYGASLSKAVFSVLVMKLVENGVLDLDTPLESYLPKKIYEYEPKTRWHDDYSALKEDSLYHKITARMCSAHTTGFANWRWGEPDYKLQVHGTPGSKYMYSGEGFVYLQVVLEKMTGKGLEELAQQYIFKPLGMKNSSYEWKERFATNFAYGHNRNDEIYKKDIDNEPRAGSTLETTAEDYSKFLEAVLQKKLISEASWEEIFSPQIRIHSKKQFGPQSNETTTKYDAIELSYGLGWGLIKTPYGVGAFKEGHGNGFQHYSIVFPKAKKGIMMMTNSDNGESIYEILLKVGLRDIYTPADWELWIPFDSKEFK